MTTCWSPVSAWQIRTALLCAAYAENLSAWTESPRFCLNLPAFNRVAIHEEIGEVITHMAFYAGWPTAMTAGRIARKVFEEAKS